MNIWLALSGGFGFLAVLSGALGAHVIGDQLTGIELRQFETAVRYQMWHALALLAVALCAAQDTERQRLSLRVAGWAFASGIVLFSGSLYAVSLTNTRGFAHLAPIGGLLLLTGWVALFLHAFSLRK